MTITNSPFLAASLDGEYGRAPLFWRSRAARAGAYGALICDPATRVLDVAIRCPGDAVSRREYCGEIWAGRIPLEISPAGLQSIVADHGFVAALAAWSEAGSQEADALDEIFAQLVDALAGE